MPASKSEQARERDRRAVEKSVEARCLLVKFEEGAIGELHVQTNGVGSAVGAMSQHAADVGPTRRGDASSVFPKREPRGNDDDASELIHRFELQLLANPGRTRACVCVGSRMTAAMLSYAITARKTSESPS